MTPSEIDRAMEYVRKMYPRAVIVHTRPDHTTWEEHRWPEERQAALRDRLAGLRIEFAQFMAVVDEIAMTGKNSWCPPEGEILRRLRGLGEQASSGVLDRNLTEREDLIRDYLRATPSRLADLAQQFRETDERGRLNHWPDSWFVADKKGMPNQYVWTVHFLTWAAPKIDAGEMADYANENAGKATVQEWTRRYTEDPSLGDNLNETQLKGLAMLTGSRERRVAQETEKQP